jgi:hypothetical protein
MRWFVDVGSVGKGAERHRYCVDADSWQRALQAARALRDDPGPMTGFSIELLDDGFSALDPVKRLRYSIRKATADDALTSEATPPVLIPAERSLSSPPPPPPESGTEEKIPKSRSSRPPAPDLNLSPKSSKSKKSTPAPPTVAVSEPVVILPPAPSPPATSAVSSATASPTAASPGIPRPGGPVIAEPAPVAPATASLEVLLKREQNPGPLGPLTYREYAFFVPVAPTNEEATRLLRRELEGVQATVAKAKPGKLVHLALFTERFTGRPAGPPLATLMWKDWRGEPVVAFPDPNSPRVSNAPPTSLPGSFPPPTARPSAPVSAPPPSASAHPSAPGEAPSSVLAVPRSATLPFVSPGEIAVHAAPPSEEVPPPESTIPEPVALAASRAPERASEVDALGATVAVDGAGASTAARDGLDQTLASEPPPSPTAPPSTGSSAPPESLAPATTRAEELPPTHASVPAPKPRLRGDELIADLFESMHDLQFLSDAIGGADFCLTLALEKMPANGGIVHLYDIDHREFVITCAGGDGGEGLLYQRNSEHDPILAPTMRKRRPLVLADATTSEHARDMPRYATLGGARSLLVAPVALGGRFLGAIELLNPIDGVPFTDDDGHALAYIAEQLASFVAERGVVLERSGEAAPQVSAAVAPVVKGRRGARAR